MTNKREEKIVSIKENRKKKQRKEANGSSEIYDGDADVKQLGEKDYVGSNNQKDDNKRKNRIITDSRFAAAQFDPRFQRMSKCESKVVIDSRFTRMFSDKNFEPSAAPVDKRGKRKKGQAVNPLLYYYHHHEDKEHEEEEEEQALAKEEGSDGVQSDMDVSAEDIEEGIDDKAVEERSIASSPSDEYSSTDDEDTEDDDGVGESVNSDLMQFISARILDTFVPFTETHRLAIVNMDWDHIKAVDLYVVMSSYLSKGGQILSVTIYPTEYGLKSMEIEAIHGPFGLIDGSNEDGKGSSDIENEKLRIYELNKLRYYEAVAICDSVDTASHLYGTLNGYELLETSNVFHLRFISDSMEFKHPPRDEAKEAPASYKKPEFQTLALQHTQVKLTWEEDEPERKKILRRKFNPDQLDEFDKYLASSGDSDEYDSVDEDNDDLSGLHNGEGKKRKRAEELRALLLYGNDSDGEKNDVDMEITFNTKLEDLSKRILEKDKKSETVWEAVLRKQSEKKKTRKKSKHYEDDSSDYDIKEAPTDDFFDEEPNDAETNLAKKGNAPSKERRKDNAVKKDLRDLEEQEASRAELELLAEDQGPMRGPTGYNLKPKKVKNKKGKEVTFEDKLPNVDVSIDSRFSALFTSHLYALDPTDPQYKRSAAFARQRVKKQNYGAEPEALPEDSTFNTSEQVNNATTGKEDGMTTTDSLADGKDGFFSTIRSLKRNVGTWKNQPKGR